ncbi:hypothetical protein LI177_02880 [bacterium 210820-DFI.6.37]|nr:hypothetical protein [bacterium 210820-DFI.6.37]
MPKVTKEFNKAEYDKQFQREHYKKITAAFTKEEAAKVEAAAAAAGVSKSQYIKQAVFDKMEREDGK